MSAFICFLLHVTTNLEGIYLGGLGDVAGALPKAFARRGHRVMVRFSNFCTETYFPNKLLTPVFRIRLEHFCYNPFFLLY